MLEYRAKASQVDKLRHTTVVCPVFSDKRLNSTAAALDKTLSGILSTSIKKVNFLGSVGETLLLLPSEANVDRVLLVGMGKDKTLDADTFLKALQKVYSALTKTGTKEATFLLSDCIRKRLDTKWCTRKLIEVLTDSAYDFVEYKTSSPPKSAFKKMVLHTVNRKGLPEIEKGILEGVAIARAKNATKDLGNRPAHDCTPTFIAKEAEKLAKKHSSISVDVLDEKAMKKLGMGCFLSVTQASVEAAKLVCIEYKPKGNKDKKPVVLVGKGITFDTGGLSLKPAKGMVPMKYDMLGAATVLSVLQAVAELNLSIPVIGVMACAENCIGSNATKPSAVVKSMKGLTVEVTNTDAEGRLVLSDALTYVERYNPDCVIDMATLTGGVIVALGDVASGVMSNHPPLQKALENAAESSRDLIWPLPIWDCYREKLDSQVADMRNEAGFPSSVLAGVFLSHFTQAYHWAHLDIAGTAFSESKMATGRPVPLLIEFLLARTTK